MEELKKISTPKVLIIGSGPAGLSAGLTCLHLGLDVLIIGGKKGDKSRPETFESIHPGVLTLLESLKINGLPSECISGYYSYISDGTRYQSLNPYTEDRWSGYHITKSKFEEYLKQQAISQNLKIWENEVARDIIRHFGRVVGIKSASGKDFYADFIIDASGSSMFLGNKLKLEKKYYSNHLIVSTGIYKGNKVKTLESNTAYFIPINGGWCWLACLTDGTLYWTHLNIEKGLNGLFEILNQDIVNIITQKTANMRWRIFKPTFTEGAILCGDAACLIDPAGGQGILNALFQGILAAKTVHSCLEKPGLELSYLLKYDEWLNAEYSRKINQLRNSYSEFKLNIAL